MTWSKALASEAMRQVAGDDVDRAPGQRIAGGVRRRERQQSGVALEPDDVQLGQRAARHSAAAPVPAPASSTRSPGRAGTAAASRTGSIATR